MKCLKMLGLAAVAAMALMAFVGAGTASATKLCLDPECKTHLAKGGTITASLSESLIIETSGGTTLNTCSGSTLSGVTSATEGSPLNGSIESLTWSSCTRTVKTIVNGGMQIQRIGETNDGDFAVSSEVTVDTGLGSCVYGPSGFFQKFGTLDGNSPATISVNASLSLISGGILCPTQTLWTTTYVVKTPEKLYVGT